MMKRSLFAPKELKKESYISRFRSIYMPYWIYKAEMEERVTFGAREARQKEQSGKKLMPENEADAVADIFKRIDEIKEELREEIVESLYAEQKR